MTVIDSIILGLTQGLTEFIPVSSSGHLVLMQNFLNGASDHSFLEFINIGTLLALLIFFRGRVFKILHRVFAEKDFRLARNLLLTSIPAGILGFLLADLIGSSAFFGSVITVAVALVVVGVVMIALDKLPILSKVADGEKLPPLRALGIGVAQVLALIPGVSRSGSTIIAGRISGMPTEKAAEYSFLASIPIMLGVATKMFLKSADRAYLMDNLGALVVSNAVAFVAGMFAIKFLLDYLNRKDSLKVFGIYRIILAAVVLVVSLVA